MKTNTLCYKPDRWQGGNLFLFAQQPWQHLRFHTSSHPFEEQKEIVKRINALFKKADTIMEQYEKAKAMVDKLDQSVLAKAFRGELAR
jgi:hypothetical protein